MKKYKILKPFPGFDEGETISELTIYNGVMSLNIDLNNTYWFEEFKEDLPKFKVGDYVVGNKKTSFGNDIYIKIHSIHTIDNEFAYNFEKFRENNLRLPTEEELKKYFR